MQDEASRGSQPPQQPQEQTTSPRLARSRTRHSSLRQLHQAAANALSRRLSSTRFSLTRQQSVTSTDGDRQVTATVAAATATATPDQAPSSPCPAAFSLTGRRRLSRSPHQLSGPTGVAASTGAASKFQLLAPMSPTARLSNSLVHQRSNESHDSTTSGVSMMSAHSSQQSDREFKMDLMNFKKQDSLGCDDIGFGLVTNAGGAVGGGSGAAAAGAGGASGVKQDDASMKGLWRRAFNILKTKDKDKDKGKKKRNCKDEEDAADVDPVYSLLKRAADKGVQKCTSCSSPRASDASLLSLSPVSLSSSWLPSPPPQLQPCDPVTCECLCHRAQLIPCITVNDLKPQPKQHHNHYHQFHHRAKVRSKSLTADGERLAELEQQQQQKGRLRKQLSEDEAFEQPQQPVWGGRGRISATFETGWSRDLQPQSLPE